MRHHLMIFVAMLALGLAGTWLSLGHEPPPRLAVSQCDDPAGTTATQPSASESEIIAPAGDAAPRVQTPPAAPKVFVPPPPESTPDLNGDLATLEAHWQELRRQGRWREAAPLWEEIKQRRADTALVAPTAQAGELEGSPVRNVLTPPDGGWLPAEPPRLDMLPGPLPGGRVHRALDDAKQEKGSLRIALICPTRHPGKCSVAVRLFDADGKLILGMPGETDADGVVVFDSVPTRAVAFEVYSTEFETSTRESCTVRHGEETDCGRLTLTAKSNK